MSAAPSSSRRVTSAKLSAYAASAIGVGCAVVSTPVLVLVVVEGMASQRIVSLSRRCDHYEGLALRVGRSDEQVRILGLPAFGKLDRYLESRVDETTVQKNAVSGVVAYNEAEEEVARDQLVMNSGSHRFEVRMLEPRKGRTYTGSLRMAGVGSPVSDSASTGGSRHITGRPGVSAGIAGGQIACAVTSAAVVNDSVAIFVIT